MSMHTNACLLLVSGQFLSCNTPTCVAAAQSLSCVGILTPENTNCGLAFLDPAISIPVCMTCPCISWDAISMQTGLTGWLLVLLEAIVFSMPHDVKAQAANPLTRDTLVCLG